MEHQSRHFSVPQKVCRSALPASLSPSANLLPPRFRRRNDGGTRVGVFVKNFFVFRLAFQSGKKPCKRSRTIYEFGTFSCDVVVTVSAQGNTGTSEKKPCGAMPTVTPLPRADTSFGACTQLTCAAEVRAQTALSSVSEARGRTVRRDCAKPEVRPNDSGSRRGSSVRAVRAKKRARGSDRIASHSAQAQ